MPGADGAVMSRAPGGVGGVGPGGGGGGGVGVGVVGGDGGVGEVGGVPEPEPDADLSTTTCAMLHEDRLDGCAASEPVMPAAAADVVDGEHGCQRRRGEIAVGRPARRRDAAGLVPAEEARDERAGAVGDGGGPNEGGVAADGATARLHGAVIVDAAISGDACSDTRRRADPPDRRERLGGRGDADVHRLRQHSVARSDTRVAPHLPPACRGRDRGGGAGAGRDGCDDDVAGENARGPDDPDRGGSRGGLVAVDELGRGLRGCDQRGRGECCDRCRSERSSQAACLTAIGGCGSHSNRTPSLGS